ncbi:MAG: T9SS C-terminal target domain-containing protein [Balneolaceae bacterium]|nr:MAG: T9SS C-terminal target domain-containing protein [Balneolaceae bacterium]
MKKLLPVLLFLFTTTLLSAQSLPIAIDGEFDDWENASLIFEIDPAAPAPNGIHVKRIRAANDDRFLFLNIEVDREITLLENNPLVLLIDSDNDITTGYDPGSTGAELRWVFGSRSGTFHAGSTSHAIQFAHIRLRTAPTVTSTVFEIAIGRDTHPDSFTPLFQADTVTVHLQGDGSAHASGTYVFDPEPVPSPEPIPLGRFDASDLRVLAFNAWNDKLFNEQFTDEYRRILEALNPDIIAFQEIWDHNAQQTAQRVETLLPSGDDAQWHAVKLDRGNVTVSKYPVLDSWHILVGEQQSDGHRLTATLIDLQHAYNTNLMLVNIHLRCCARGETNRWNEVAALAGFINDAREEGGLLHLPEGTPIILAGDFNLVGSSGQLAAIETGIIDWDGSGFERVHARQTQKRMHYTWRNDNGGFSPGKLDYIFYTSSSLTLKNRYTLQVEEMSVDQRALYNLYYGDTQVASDHLPHVADYAMRQSTSSNENSGVINSYSLEQNYPNPFNPSTTITFTAPEPGPVRIDVFDVLGRRVADLANETYASGVHNIAFDASALPSGIFLIRMNAGEQVLTRKMTLLK